MSKTNAIELLKNIKWHCEHEEPDGEFIVGTIDMALKELASKANVYYIGNPRPAKARKV